MLWQLFFSFFKIGLLSFGGGYAVLPLIEEEVVRNQHWLTGAEYADLLTISQITPGPITINAASFVGTKIHGLPGSILATLGCISPPVIISLLLAWVYTRFKEQGLIQGVLSGLRPAIVGLISSACVSIVILTLWGQAAPLLGQNIDYLALSLLFLTLVLLKLKIIKPIGAIALSGFAGVISHFLNL